jgi:hypothetical protein
MGINWFFWRKKEAALEKAKQLEKQILPDKKELKKQDEKLTKDEKALKKVFAELQSTKGNAKKGKKSKAKIKRKR